MFFCVAGRMNLEDTYQTIAKKYMKFLPNSPITKFGLQNVRKRKLTKKIQKLCDDVDIKNAIEFYNDNHDEIGDNQNIYKIIFLLQCIKETEYLKGDIIELGTYRGGNSIIMSQFLKQIKSDKKIFACDTFSGIPLDDSNVKDIAGCGYFSDTNLETVKKKLKEYDAFNVELIIGDFRDTLSNLDKEKFSLVFIDCNIFSSAKLAINFSYPRLVKDGVLFSHCYGAPKGKGSTSLWGETYAVKEYLSNKLEKIVIESIPFMQKGHKIPKITNKMPKNKYSTYVNPDNW